jgi:hypothetical protein
VSKIDAAPQSILDRLARIDVRNPRLDRAAVERALRLHLRLAGEQLRPMRWTDSGRLEWAEWDASGISLNSGSSIDPMFRARWCATRLKDLELIPGGDNGHLEREIRIWRPLVDAAEAGLFRYWATWQEIICVPRPALFMDGRRLHRADGPAVVWRSGECHWFWHGVEVPPWVIERPERITADAICDETNLELRRWLIERFGAQRLIDELGGELVAKHAYGRLWRCRVDEREAETYAVLEVENGTVEADGSRRRYCLRVPPDMRTPREAVAWTYGLRAHEYELMART